MLMTDVNTERKYRVSLTTKWPKMWKAFSQNKTKTRTHTHNPIVCIPAWMHFIGTGYGYFRLFPLISLLSHFNLFKFIVVIPLRCRCVHILLFPLVECIHESNICAYVCVHAYSSKSNSFGIPFHVHSNCLLFLLHRFEFVKFYSN